MPNPGSSSEKCRSASAKATQSVTTARNQSAGGGRSADDSAADSGESEAEAGDDEGLGEDGREDELEGAVEG